MGSDEWREWGRARKSKRQIGRWESVIRGAWLVLCGLWPATEGMEGVIGVDTQGQAFVAATQGEPFGEDAQGEPFVKATQGRLVRDGHAEW